MNREEAIRNIEEALSGHATITNIEENIGVDFPLFAFERSEFYHSMYPNVSRIEDEL